jgi:ubiquinol-cytochrome c reductase cytochrome c1 subunit
MKPIIYLMLIIPLASWSAESGYRLDRSPHEPTDLVSLQAGARTFVNYCLGCHGAQHVRYNSLTEIGLTEDQIRENLMFTGEKVGDTMRTAMRTPDAKKLFGVAPPDLSTIGRVRGADWLYTYLRTFYRDPKTATGWNNAVFTNVAMPHALWQLQGERAYDREKHEWREFGKGTLSVTQYDTVVRDLVNFLVYIAEPSAQTRKAIGIVMLFVLGILFVLAWLVKKEFWKDVK